MTHRDDNIREDNSSGDFWVFGYGSLMWNPGFDHIERRAARIDGYRRAFRLLSIHYRGTEDSPGLVVGLDWAPGAACTGVAFRVPANRADAAWAYLADRELIASSYFEVCLPATLLCEGLSENTDKGERERVARGAQVDAVCYVLDRTHPQYAHTMTVAEQAEQIRSASGPMGPNIEYFEKTMAHLEDMGIRDSGLDELAAHLRGNAQ